MLIDPKLKPPMAKGYDLDQCWPLLKPRLPAPWYPLSWPVIFCPVDLLLLLVLVPIIISSLK